MSDKLNVLIFMTDQWRYDACGCYGSTVCRTPNVDRLAASGVRFTNAYTTTPHCSPARASFWTGLWTNHHGVLINTHWRSPVVKGKVDDDVPMLSQLFKAAGYRTAHFGKWHVGPNREMSRVGFDYVVNGGDYRQHVQASAVKIKVRDKIVRPYILQNYTFAGITTAEGDLFYETWLGRRAEGWVRAQVSAGEPFFCCVSMPGPHPPYVVPESYATLYDPAQISVWPNTHDELVDKPAVHRLYSENVTSGATLSDDEWRTCIARYYSFIALIDDGLGRMLDLLNELGVADNTLIVFCSDHGDLIGAHRLWDKGPFMYEEQIHVPLVVRWPGVTPGGQACDAMVSWFDLMPTLAEAAGLNLPRPVDARSLVPLLRGEAVADWPDDVYLQYHGEAICLYSIRAVRSRRYKYVYYPFDRDELYDLETDRWEMRNLAQDPGAAPILAEMKERMACWMRRTEDVLLDWNRDLTPKRERF